MRRGVYAVGRPQLTIDGHWMAAILYCGSEAVLSHESAAALWRFLPLDTRRIHISVPMHVNRRQPDIDLHRRQAVGSDDVRTCRNIPLTSPVCTLIDLAARLDRHALEAAINEADKRGLTNPEQLRSTLDEVRRRPGTGVLRKLLDRRTFTFTESELERRFLPIARRAGLSTPETGSYVNGFKVDFYWRELGLIVETDGLRYHRTPAQQARDRVRDQAHTTAGLTPLRFTHGQVRFDPGYVEATLTTVARRLRA